MAWGGSVVKKILLRQRVVGLFLILLSLSSVTSLLNADEIVKIRVRKGDTISYLSFKMYGMYDGQIAEILKAENPQVKDLDWIYVGQQLNFPAAEALRGKVGDKTSKAAKPRVEMETKQTGPSPAPSSERPAATETQVRANKGVITYLEGPVQVKRSGETQWSSARPNMILLENDQVKVPGQSRAELILDSQSVMRLSENTLLTIHKLEEEKATRKETARMDISAGKLWVRMAKLFNPASRYDVKSPTVIAGVQGTVYQIMVAGDQSTTIQVFQGAVNVYNPFPKATPSEAGKAIEVEKPHEVAGPQVVPGPTTVSREAWTQIVLHQFQQITVTGQGVPHPTSFDPKAERQTEWVRWNEERDADFNPPAKPQ
jgi:phage tail protein X